MKKVLLAIQMIILLAILCVSSCAWAANKPVVKLMPEIYTYHMGFNNIALDESSKISLWQAVYSKLNNLQAQGKLPFVLEKVNPVNRHSFNELTTDEEIYLFPAVMINTAQDSSYSNSEETLYNSTIISGISLVFAMLEENRDFAQVSRAGNAVGYRMLGIVPLVEADTIGLVQYDNDGNVTSKRNYPISEGEKQYKFLQLAKKSLAGNWDFSGALKNLKNEYAAFDRETYQVTDVSITSNNALAAFTGNEREELKFVTAYYFTSAYQQKNKCIVYPPAVANNSLSNNVVDGMSSLSLDSSSDKVDVSMLSPKHAIRLDISGANWGYDGKLLTHRVWLAKYPVEGTEKRELDRANVRPLRKVAGNTVNVDHADVYSRLFIGLARDLGNQKIR